MADNKFVAGLIVKAPHAKAPDYVKCRLSIKREDLIHWLESQDGDWINVDVKESREGKWYAAVNDWKPDNQRDDRKPKQQKPSARADEIDDDEIPF